MVLLSPLYRQGVWSSKIQWLAQGNKLVGVTPGLNPGLFDSKSKVISLLPQCLPFIQVTVAVLEFNHCSES